MMRRRRSAGNLPAGLMDGPSFGGVDLWLSSVPNLWAYGVGRNGLWNGTRWRPVGSWFNDGGSLASDGRAAVAAAPLGAGQTLSFQRLNSSGLPTGSPTVIGNPSFVQNSDISDALSGGRRFVIYDKHQNPGGGIFLQRVDDATGAKLGTEKLVAAPWFFPNTTQLFAIDPLGRFLIHVDNSCDQWNEDFLAYQALDATGNPSGSPRIIVPCGVTEQGMESVNILME